MSEHPLKGRKRKPEHVAKCTAALKASPKFQAHLSRFAELARQRNKARTGQPLSAEHRAKISAAMEGKRNALGFKRSETFRRKLSNYWAANRQKHNHYVDGKGNSDREQFMQRLDYRLWREAVFERDDWTCQRCKQRGYKLHADHVKPYSLFPELRLEVENGRTLCEACHLSRRKWDEEYAGYVLSRNKRARKAA